MKVGLVLVLLVFSNLIFGQELDSKLMNGLIKTYYGEYLDKDSAYLYQEYFNKLSESTDYDVINIKLSVHNLLEDNYPNLKFEFCTIMFEVESKENNAGLNYLFLMDTDMNKLDMVTFKSHFYLKGKTIFQTGVKFSANSMGFQVLTYEETNQDNQHPFTTKVVKCEKFSIEEGKYILKEEDCNNR